MTQRGSTGQQLLEAARQEKYSDRQLLGAINEAIFAIAVGGQEYRIANRYLRRGDLPVLWKIKRELEALAGAEDTAAGLLSGGVFLANMEPR